MRVWSAVDQLPGIRSAYLLGAIGTTGSGIWLIRLINCTH
jgi:hypothetical protein